MPRRALTNLIYQLVDAGLLERTAGDRPVLKLNAASWEAMRGQRPVVLLQTGKPKAPRLAMMAAQDVDESLFEIDSPASNFCIN